MRQKNHADRRVCNPQLVAVWNHHEVMYGINPQENTRCRVMPYACGDSILTCGEITYQSFGLDRKKTVLKRSFFLERITGEELKTVDNCFRRRKSTKQEAREGLYARQ